jgi:hypothetical protein
MGQVRRLIPSAAVAAAAALAAACGGGGGGGDEGSGVLRVSLTDAPACGYDNVWVTVTKVRVHRSDTAADGDAGWSEIEVATSGKGRRIDLLELQNGVLADLGQTALPAGRYSQVRLVLADNREVAGANQLVLSSTGEIVALDTPSAQQSGLKLKHAFEVEAGSEADLVLDFDACRSIVKAGNSGKYNLKPVVSVIPILTGSVAGAIDPEAARGGASVSLQRFDPATGAVSVVRATSVRADGSWLLSPVPVSPVDGASYNLVIGSAGYGNVVYTNVPVATGVSTEIPGVALESVDMARISGKVIGGGGSVEVRGLQRIDDGNGATPDVVIEAGFAIPDSATGAYAMELPRSAARIAPHGGSLTRAKTAGVYDLVVAQPGESAATTETVDISAGDVVIDLPF